MSDDCRLSVNTSSASNRVSGSTVTLRQIRPSERGGDNGLAENDKRWFRISTKSTFPECISKYGN